MNIKSLDQHICEVIIGLRGKVRLRLMVKSILNVALWNRDIVMYRRKFLVAHDSSVRLI